jgi:hypothetical protein
MAIVRINTTQKSSKPGIPSGNNSQLEQIIQQLFLKNNILSSGESALTLGYKGPMKIAIKNRSKKKGGRKKKRFLLILCSSLKFIVIFKTLGSSKRFVLRINSI